MVLHELLHTGCRFAMPRSMAHTHTLAQASPTHQGVQLARTSEEREVRGGGELLMQWFNQNRQFLLTASAAGLLTPVNLEPATTQ